MKKAQLILVGMTSPQEEGQRQFFLDLLIRSGLYDRNATHQSVDIDQLRTAYLLRPDCEITIIIGGIGLSPEDRTIQELADILRVPLEYDEEIGTVLGSFVPGPGGQPRLYDCAWLPQGAIVLDSLPGSAPGCILEFEQNLIICLPGNPDECAHLLQNKVLPFIHNVFYGKTVTHNMMIFGLSDEQLKEKLTGYLGRINPTLDIKSNGLFHRLSVSATARDSRTAENICQQTIPALFRLLGTAAFGTDCGRFEEVVINLLRHNGLRIATAESCTAGMLSSRLVNVAGASQFFDLGIACYAADKKVNVLKVPVDVIRMFGEVSAETAVSMASGIQQLAQSDLGIAITGIAGPNGGTAQKPVGLVYIALTDKNYAIVQRLRLGSDKSREYIREMSVLYALDLVRKYLMGYPAPLKGSVSLREVGENIRRALLYPASAGANHSVIPALESPSDTPVFSDLFVPANPGPPSFVRPPVTAPPAIPPEQAQEPQMQLPAVQPPASANRPVPGAPAGQPSGNMSAPAPPQVIQPPAPLTPYQQQQLAVERIVNERRKN